MIQTLHEGLPETVERSLVELPDPDGGERHAGITLHRIELSEGTSILMTFGRIPFQEMFKAVREMSGYPLDLSDPDELVDALGRISYHRVSYVELADSFRIRWDRGITPITVFQL